MTAVAITIDDRQIVDYFHALGQRLGNPRPLLDELGAVLESRVQQRFDTKTDPAGAAWTPWAKSTARQRAKSGRGTLLEQTRRLRNSLTHAADRQSVTVGFGVPYAAAHEFGAQIERFAYSRRVNFKVDMETGKSRFAKKGKGNFQQQITYGAWTQKIPPRRMLTADGQNLGEADRRAVLEVLESWLMDKA